jgi:hypothetical protein
VKEMRDSGERVRGDERILGGSEFVDRVLRESKEEWERRDVVEGGHGYQLREAAAGYKPLFEDENEDVGLENAYFRNLNAEESISWRGPTPQEP